MELTLTGGEPCWLGRRKPAGIVNDVLQFFADWVMGGVLDSIATTIYVLKMVVLCTQPKPDEGRDTAAAAAAAARQSEGLGLRPHWAVEPLVTHRFFCK